MYAHTDEHVDLYLKSVKKVFGLIKKFELKDEIRSRLDGEPASKGFARLA